MNVALLMVAAVVLIVSGGGHLRDRAGLATTLDRHDVLPARARQVTSAGLPALELVLGLALVAAVVTGAVTASVALGLGASALFLVFALYLHRASRAPGASGMPCGCGLGQAPLGVWVVVRALLLAVLSATGAVGVATGLQGTASAGVGGVVEATVSAAAVLSLVVAISVLPAARAVPGAGRGVTR